MIPVILESPYAGDVERNLEYARRAMKDCLKRGEAPFASHLLYTQCLDDTNHEERRLGIEAGFVWRTPETKTVVYLDYGTSGGMARGIHNAHKKGSLVELRKIGKNPGDES